MESTTGERLCPGVIEREKRVLASTKCNPVCPGVSKAEVDVSSFQQSQK